MSIIVEGQIAPDFTLPRDGGGTVALSALRPAKVVLFFYPRANTPACTTEAVDFTGLLPEFRAAGAEVLGISKDSVKAQDKFRTKQELGVILGSDEEGQVCEDYGVWAEKQMYGRTYMGILRTTFLIDGEGKIVRVWPDVKVKDHAAAVLEAVRRL